MTNLGADKPTLDKQIIVRDTRRTSPDLARNGAAAALACLLHRVFL
jgi:hypothetical protein